MDWRDRPDESARELRDPRTGARSGSVSWVDADGHFWLFGGDHSNPTAFTNELWRFDGTNWTWVSGSSAAGQHGNYGTKGVRAASNVPGARTGAVSWIDDEGNLWLFGGWGLDGNGEEGSLNDLWRYTP